MSGAELFAKVASAWQVLRSRVILRKCTIVGRWSRAFGTSPVVVNRGRIELGSRVRLFGEYGRIELRSAPGATLRIGERTTINYGTVLDAANADLTLGADVMIGPYSIFDTTVGGDEPAGAIVVGDGAWITSRVTVLPGSTIGAHAVIMAGSVVDGDIPCDVVAGGIPARTVRPLKRAAASEPGSTMAPSREAER
jgi:maltose O-acetyltransferase